jgi:hypothetical protein
MGDDRIRYLVFVNGRWRWRPTKTMRSKGFRIRTLGPGVVVNGVRLPTAAEKAEAVRLNDEWDQTRRCPAVDPVPKYQPGSLGHCYQRALAIRAKARHDKGLPPLTKEQESRDDWRRAWIHVEWLADCDPNTVTPEILQQIRGDVASEVSQGEAHRVIKVWRALWKKMRAMKAAIGEDPSLTFANSAPDPRQGVWQHQDALRLVQRAWRQGYYGLAAVIAVAWDTMLSPIDVRQLTAGQRVRDDQGALFFVDRAKTGRAAAGTLSRWSSATLDAYLGKISVVPVGDAPLFRNRSGAPYSKDTLGDDFRAVRTMVFGKNDNRQLADIRRSGAVEATVGGAKVEKLAKKMANTISASTRLQKVYNPVDVESVRSVDRSREQARRERKANEKCHRRRPESVTKTDPKR